MKSCFWDSKDGSRGYYDKWNVRQSNTDTTWSHLYVESKTETKQNKNRPIETETKPLVVWRNGCVCVCGEVGKGDEEVQTSGYIINKWASLVAQWLRVCLPMQGTRVRALVWEDPTCRGAAGPVSHNYWACAYGACAPQQERPRQWEARAPRWRVAPTCHN